jgi:predicted Zn finger-like uncharacterized protein
MLLTRCPGCQTTFRISEEVLRKAAGQVRCGRCSNTFNAYRDLRESPDTPKAGATSAAGERERAALRQNATTPVVSPQAPRGEPVPEPAARSTAKIDAPDELPPAGAPPAEPSGSSVPPLADLDSIGAGGLWALEPVPPSPQLPSRLWSVAAAIAGLALIAQVAHSFSAVLATQVTLGPLVQRVYSALGLPLVPRWDIDRYEVVSATAATNPGTSGRGALVITAEIRNRGAVPQPYPHVQLRLLDRWESTVGKRVFAPAEYATTSVRPDTLLDPGANVTAELVVVDPGPNAAGFEIDVCVVGATRIRCAADDVFK